MTEIFDRAHFAHMTGHDTALQAEIVGLFRGQVTKWQSALDPHAPAPDWRDVVHTMKGSARGIGFGVLAEACESAEKCADGDVKRELIALHAALQGALAALP